VQLVELADFGLLPAAARSFDAAGATSIYDSLVPLAEKDGYTDVKTEFPTSATSALAKSEAGSSSGSLVLHFN
jgi:hypothetical protein